MNHAHVTTAVLILAGALLMMISIIKSRAVYRRLDREARPESEKVKWFFRVHEILMIFFLLGYVTVAYATFMEIHLANELFVGIIFFLGAVFVLTGIILKSIMISTLKHRYDQLVSTGDQLHAERKRLEKANLDLVLEIDERRQIEKALIDSKAFLQNLIDVFPEQITVINRDYSIALANAKVRENIPPGTNIKNLACHQVSHRSDTPCSGNEHPCPLNEILRLRKPVTMEHTHHDAQGQELYVEIVAAPIYDQAGEIVQIIEVSHDITERKHATVALKESEERYKNLSEVTFEGICFHDKGFILDANSSFFKMFGYTLPELTGKNSIDFLIVPEDRSIVLRRVAQGYTRPYEVMAQRKDGTIFPVEIEGRNVRYMDQTVRVAAFRDITERWRTEKKLSQAQKMEAIGTLAGGIAHDFNNILSAIMGYTEMLKLETTLENPKREKLNRILQASYRARDLVHQILSFSRQQEEELQPVQVSLIAREALKLLRASIPTTIAFHADIQENSGAVLADPTQIHQVLMNLCTNASHAMLENGGTLTVAIKNVVLEENFTQLNPDLKAGPHVLLSVTDTGHGMRPETVQRIFEPYYTTKDPGIGTGLGLAAVHGIIQRYGGAIEVASQPGEGATFRLYFPMIENDARVDTADLTAPQRGDEKILLVDDDQLVLEMTCDLLTALGYHVDPRISSLDALTAFQRHPEKYDLVLTDLTMPHLSGDQLVEKVKNIRPDIPVVLCTGFSETLTTGKIEQLGVSGFLMKPIVMRDLADTIRAALDRNQVT